MPPTHCATTKPKKKKGRSPARQNDFAFQHNAKSKLTAKILGSPNVGVCSKCHDKIEWRRKYRKYKPLTQAAICNICKRRNIKAAYHTICNDCARGKEALARLEKNKPSLLSSSVETATPALVVACAICVKHKIISSTLEEKRDYEISIEISKMEENLGRILKLRERRTIERKVTLRLDNDDNRLKKKKDDDDDQNEDEERLVVPPTDININVKSNNADIKTSTNSISDQSNYAITENNTNSAHDTDEEDDPFLNAIGGGGVPLTGDAYRKYLLEKEQTAACQNGSTG